MKIVHLDSATTTMDGLSLHPLDKFDHFVSYESTSEQQVIERAIEADILLVNKVVLNGEIMDQLPNLKYISVCGTGYNNVDAKAARQRNIPVSNVRGYSTNSVVQHVFSMLLHVINNVAYYDEEVMDNRWVESNHFSFYDHSILELNGMTMGIYGYGTIGKMISRVAQAFGMNVLATRRNVPAQNEEGIQYVDFDTLLKESDVLTLHSSLNESNAGIMDHSAFSKMKPSSILINTARGGLINEKDLAEALNNDKIAFACLDVLSTEPPSAQNPVLNAKNCIITPHIAWTSVEARRKLLVDTAENIKAFIENRPLLNVVNEVI